MAKKFLYGFLAVLLLAAPLTTNAATASAKYTTYKNAELGVSLKYPKGWTTSESKENPTLTKITFKPSTDVPQMDLLINDLTENELTLDQYVNELLKNVGGEGLSVENTKKKKTKLAKRKALRVVLENSFEEPEGELFITTDLITMVKNKKAYSLLMHTLTDNYKADKKVFEKMLKSLKVK